jgi:hypothetical protein
LLACAARRNAQAVVHCPIPDANPAHTEVRGQKTRPIANRLKDASAWVLRRDSATDRS